jgi:presenilin 1
MEQARSHSDSSSTKSGHLRYGAKNVIELFIPVSICMFIVVGTMKATNSYRYSSQTVIWYAQVMFTDQTVDTGTRVWQSFANALIMLVLIMVMTTVLILLYKFRCYKTIHGWLILSSLMLLFIFAIMYIAEILKVYNIPMDIYTLMIFIWNFGVVGMICIHWKGPLLLQQGYLITISALLALVFIRSLPDWTTWTVLGIVSVWDLVAVLCPRGPLRILVETAQERGEAIFPALIYSSTMMWQVVTTVIVTSTPSITMSDMDPKPSGSGSSSNRRQNRRDRARQSAVSHATQQASTNRPELKSPTRRSQQHPVEIHYEGVTQPPEIDIIQPTISGTSGDWANTIVTSIDSDGNRRSRPFGTRDRTVARTVQNSAPVDTTVNFRPQNEQIEHVQVIEDERGVKLGLGDFIFFSLLVGKASSYEDWVITLSCYVAILVGLCLTLSLLAVFRKALPALPISIAFGMCSFFMSYMFAAPFAERLSTDQVFI